jgi:hypothetical protein
MATTTTRQPAATHTWRPTPGTRIITRQHGPIRVIAVYSDGVALEVVDRAGLDWTVQRPLDGWRLAHPSRSTRR